MSETPKITILCKLPIDAESLTAIDRMALSSGKSRDQIIADFANIFAKCELPPKRRPAA